MSAVDDLVAIRTGGKALDRLLEEHERKTSDWREFMAQVRARWSSDDRRRLTEQQIADDRHETLNQKLDNILKALGTNGSGGHG